MLLWSCVAHSKLTTPAEAWLLPQRDSPRLQRACPCRHTAILVPLLGSENSGPGTIALLGTWGLSAIASTLIAIKPKE
jgi:hypothetical protein